MRILIAITLIGLLAFVACNKSTEPENVLILTDSFERFGNPTVTGWQVNSDSSLFSGDTPEGGDIFSLRLFPGNTSEGTASKLITADHGDGVYRFSVWGKRSQDQPSHTGYVRFCVIRDNILTQSTQFELTDTAWTEYAVTDTLSFEPDDRIQIFLSCGYSEEPASWHSYFDLVTIEKLAE